MMEAILVLCGFLLGYNLKREKKITITYGEFKEFEQAIKFKDSISYEKRLN